MAEPVLQSAADLQRRFNDGCYLERFLNDDDDSVHLLEIEDIGPAPPEKRPKSCRSQMVIYGNKFDETIVIAHQYGRGDGTPATGSRPDPKFIFEGGIRYKYDPSLDYVS
jgi:hypothetical protein